MSSVQAMARVRALSYFYDRCLGEIHQLEMNGTKSPRVITTNNKRPRILKI